MQLFHYHLVTSKVRRIEARYLGKLGFRLVARYGRIGDERVSYEAGVSWEELDRMDFKLRLSELERGAVNVVVQPGQWELPRVDHVGFALDDDELPPRWSAPGSESCGCRNIRGGAPSSPWTSATGWRCTRRATGSTRC